ncbi:ABC transporter permease [Catenulispora yoronensis]
MTILGAATMGDEYRSGLIVATLTAIPRRGVLLAAKAIVLSGAVFATGLLASTTSILATALISPEASGPRLGPAAHATLATAAYLALIALLALGTAAASRSTAAATALTLALLYLPPLLAATVTNRTWQIRIQRFAPMSAGLAPPIGGEAGRHQLASWSGLGIVAAWALAALAFGGLALWRRDVA